ncbi:adenosine deaminase [uncultured Croceitalea sp.]|uniref:adenosine deaminase n=1 Tax=uncultured Croceitalea sp. TaxID=1798908 RepID=UPI00374EC435
MKKIILLVLNLFFGITTVSAQSIDEYFERIRHDEAALISFMSKMPKGGDLHHHYSGSVYTESLIQKAIKDDYFLNVQTMVAKRADKEFENLPNPQILHKEDKGKTIKDYSFPNTKTIAAKRVYDESKGWKKLSVLREEGKLNEYKLKMLKQWSIQYFNPVVPSDKHFFDSFGKFREVVNDYTAEGLLEFKERAIKENVSYIETQFKEVQVNLDLSDFKNENGKLLSLASKKDTSAIFKIFDKIHNSIIKQNALEKVAEFNSKFIKKPHDSLKIDSDDFTMRYQNYVLRFMPPVDVFKNLILASISDETSDLIVGVNIVAPEHGEISMRDYWLHMLMFNYCQKKYAKANYALHAGELTLGLVKPEELTSHINDAVYLANADRIGHATGMPYEFNSSELLQYMAENKIPVEVNLTSNAFILNVEKDEHPILLFKDYGVPVVISTDDAGILRTNLTDQFVTLAKNYPSFHYADIKECVYNSLEFSFINADKKKCLLKDLDKRFIEFEKSVLEK